MRVGTAGRVGTKKARQELQAHYSACNLQQSSPSFSIKYNISVIILNNINCKFNRKYILYLRTELQTLSNLCGGFAKPFLQVLRVPKSSCLIQKSFHKVSIPVVIN